MRILAITQHFHPELGGAEVMLRRLARAWADAGHEITVWTPRWQAGWAERETASATQGGSFTVLRHDVRAWRFLGTLSYIGRLRRMLRRHAADFDVAYVSMFKHAAYAATTANAGVPVVVRAEGSGATGDMAWQRAARFGGAVRRACQTAAGFVAPSAGIRQELIAAGYDERRILLVLNGVDIPDEPWSRAAISEWRQRLRLPEAPTVVFTGRLHEGKGLHDLAAAVRLLPAGTQAVLVGEGPERTALESLTGVVCTGSVDDVAPYLRAADCFALPSYEEGLSVALLEALALGMPCVASDIPANRGLLPAVVLPLAPTRAPAALASALAPLLGATEWPHAAAQRAEVAARFSLAATARRHLELFAALAPGRR